MNQGTQTFSTFNDLRRQTGSSNAAVKVLGKDAPNDSFGGIFYYNSSSTTPDDNVDTIQPSGILTGRWLRLTLSSNSVNIGNSDLTLTGNRTLDGGGFNFTLEGTDITLITSDTQTTIQSQGTLLLSSASEPGITFSSGTIGNKQLLFSLEELTSDRSLKVPDTTGTIATQEYTDINYAKKPLVLTSNGSGVITDSYLINKDLLLLVTSGIIFEKGVHFTKTLGASTITMISPNTLLTNHNYTPTYG